MKLWGWTQISILELTWGHCLGDLEGAVVLSDLWAVWSFLPTSSLRYMVCILWLVAMWGFFLHIQQSGSAPSCVFIRQKLNTSIPLVWRGNRWEFWWDHFSAWLPAWVVKGALHVWDIPIFVQKCHSHLVTPLSRECLKQVDNRSDLSKDTALLVCVLNLEDPMHLSSTEMEVVSVLVVVFPCLQMSELHLTAVFSHPPGWGPSTGSLCTFCFVFCSALCPPKTDAGQAKCFLSTKQ